MDPNNPMFNQFFHPLYMNTQMNTPGMSNTNNSQGSSSGFPFHAPSFNQYSNCMPQSSLQSSGVMPQTIHNTEDQTTSTNPPQVDAQTTHYTNEEEIPKKKAKERIRWSQADDLKLCSAWIHISKDPVTGKDQNDKSFWKRVYNHFVECQKNSDRSVSSLISRWQKLSHAVSKFVGCMEKINARRESGFSEDDKKNKAIELYNNNEGENFTFMHVWDHLKKEEKWLTQYVTNKDTSSSEQLFSKRSKTNTGNGYISTEDSDSPMPARPPGRKASKGKGKQNEGATIEREQKKEEALEAHRSIELQKIETVEGMRKEMKKANALKFLQLDTSSMNEDQKLVYDKFLHQFLSDD